MNKVLFVVCFLLFCNANAQDKSIDSESVIQWQEAYKLQVLDYQKKRDSNDSYSFTVYKIEFYPSEVIVDENDFIQGYENLQVVAEFHMDKSHFDPDYEAELLKYEQIVFDIAELFARKIRKRFQELKRSKERRFSSYNFEYKTLWRACKKYQTQFKKATNSGWYADDEIAKWRKQVDNELNALQEYVIKPL